MNRIRFAGDVEAVALPHPSPAAVAVNAFILCPVVLPAAAMPQMLAMQWVYQRALEVAQAVARPSLPERDLLAVWN